MCVYNVLYTHVLLCTAPGDPAPVNAPTKYGKNLPTGRMSSDDVPVVSPDSKLNWLLYNI